MVSLPANFNAYDPNSGAFLGQLTNKRGAAIVIDGLWGLAFGNGASAGETDELFFTAGIGGEAHGLFGKIQNENWSMYLTAFSGAQITIEDDHSHPSYSIHLRGQELGSDHYRVLFGFGTCGLLKWDWRMRTLD